MSAQISKYGVLIACILIVICCVGTILAEEKTPPLIDPNLKFEVKEFALPAEEAKKETPPYKAILRFKEAQNELFINSPNELTVISKDTSEQTQDFTRNWLYTGKNDDNTFTIVLRATTEQYVKIMTSRVIRLIREKRADNLKRNQGYLVNIKSQIENWPNEIQAAKEELKRIEITILNAQKADWGSLSDTELQAFILELKKTIMLAGCEIAGAERKCDILKNKADIESHPLWTNRVAAEVELEGFKTKKQTTQDLLNAIDQFLFNKNRKEYLAKDIFQKERQLNKLPEGLKKTENILAEMKPIELIDNVIQIEHYQLAR